MLFTTNLEDEITGVYETGDRNQTLGVTFSWHDRNHWGVN